MIDLDSCVLWLDSKCFSESYWWDRSKYRNNGVVHGAVWKSNAFYFDGVEAYVDCDNGESLNINDKLSIEFLFTPVSSGYVINKKNYDNWNSAYGVFFDKNNKNIRFHANGGLNIASNINVLNINELAHVVVVAENLGQVLFYVNGREEGSDNTPTFSGDGETCLIGARPNTGGTAAFFIGAYLHLIRVYHKLLSSNEVKILYELTYQRW